MAIRTVWSELFTHDAKQPTGHGNFLGVSESRFVEPDLCL